VANPSTTGAATASAAPPSAGLLGRVPELEVVAARADDGVRGRGVQERQAEGGGRQREQGAPGGGVAGGTCGDPPARPARAPRRFVSAASDEGRMRGTPAQRRMHAMLRPPSATPVKVLLADDEALVRSGVRWMLEAAGDLEVVGEAADGGEAVDLAVSLRPHVVLMDIRMPRLDGIAATRRLLAALGDQSPKVIVLTTFDFEKNVYEALRAGASGFLLKDSEPERLVDGVRTVARGEALLAPAVTRRLIEHYTAAPRRHSALRGTLAELTERELELLALLARGLSNAELAERLGLTEATVKSHLSSTFAKLGLRSRTQAVVLAYESGLVEPGRGGDA
jgi:DNA-binding NarL/FixJ family response regulator